MDLCCNATQYLSFFKLTVYNVEGYWVADTLKQAFAISWICTAACQKAAWSTEWSHC